MIAFGNNVIFALLRLFCLSTIGLSSLCLAADTTSIVNKLAPIFRLPDQSSGIQYNLLNQFSPDSQHAVVVSFFASWCSPCRSELSILQHLYDSLESDGFRLVVVCVDSIYGSEQVKMVSEIKITSPVIHDRYGIVARRFSLKSALPYSVFIRRNGIVSAAITGYDDAKKDYFRNLVSDLLRRTR